LVVVFDDGKLYDEGSIVAPTAVRFAPPAIRSPALGLAMSTSNDANNQEDFPLNGRIAGVDFGSVRIGISICDPDWILASPLMVHPAADWKDDGDYFRELAQREHIVGFVVGLPIHCDGGESEKSVEAREFARWLAEETDLPVRLFDERFTTVDAKNRMMAGRFTRGKEKKRIDAVAALVLLESFLEACRYWGTAAGEAVETEARGGDSLET
jgi:putative Holliday junction resolvase